MVPTETREDSATGVQEGYKNILSIELTVGFLETVVIE